MEIHCGYDLFAGIPGTEQVIEVLVIHNAMPHQLGEELGIVAAETARPHVVKHDFTEELGIDDDDYAALTEGLEPSPVLPLTPYGCLRQISAMLQLFGYNFQSIIASTVGEVNEVPLEHNVGAGGFCIVIEGHTSTVNYLMCETDVAYVFEGNFLDGVKCFEERLINQSLDVDFVAQFPPEVTGQSRQARYQLLPQPSLFKAPVTEEMRYAQSQLTRNVVIPEELTNGIRPFNMFLRFLPGLGD